MASFNSFTYACILSLCLTARASTPIVIATWYFTEATSKAWDLLSDGGSALDAVETGASACEALQCDGTVGYGGSPDEHGETTLDALIMDGKTMNVGAVGALRNVKRAISVARRVLEHTSHSILVGELATNFATSLGFKAESLATPHSKRLWIDWRQSKCQPNFWQAVTPNPQTSCGPYHINKHRSIYKPRRVDRYNHDTIGIVAIDLHGDIAAGTSSNGAKFKIPGRVGDSPLPGSGAYADNTVGAAAATGDGDIMLRFCPSFLAVEEMRRGSSPASAAEAAVKRIASHYPRFMGAVIALSKSGEYGAACNGIDTFPYSLHNTMTNITVVKHVKCIHS